MESRVRHQRVRAGRTPFTDEPLERPESRVGHQGFAACHIWNAIGVGGTDLPPRAPGSVPQPSTALTGPATTTAVSVVNEPGRQRGQGYCTDAALRITAGDGAREIELGDGGLTTWTGQLMNNTKERCLISCLATERLSALAEL